MTTEKQLSLEFCNNGGYEHNRPLSVLDSGINLFGCESNAGDTWNEVHETVKGDTNRPDVSNMSESNYIDSPMYSDSNKENMDPDDNVEYDDNVDLDGSFDHGLFDGSLDDMDQEAIQDTYNSWSTQTTNSVPAFAPSTTPFVPRSVAPTLSTPNKPAAYTENTDSHLPHNIDLKKPQPFSHSLPTNSTHKGILKTSNAGNVIAKKQAVVVKNVVSKAKIPASAKLGGTDSPLRGTCTKDDGYGNIIEMYEAGFPKADRWYDPDELYYDKTIDRTRLLDAAEQIESERLYKRNKTNRGNAVKTRITGKQHVESLNARILELEAEVRGLRMASN